MKRRNSFLASLFLAFAVGLSAFADLGGDLMRLTPVGYRLGATGGVTAYAASVVTVTPGDTSIVVTNKPVTLTAVLNRDYKVVHWQKFDVDPTVRTTADPIEEFGEGDETVSVEFNADVRWMYVVVVVKYDPVRTVKATLSSFSRGTVVVSPEKTSYQKGDAVTLTVEPEDGYDFVRWSDGNADHVRKLTVDGDVDLLAYLEPKSSRVTFSPGEGAVLGMTEKRVTFASGYGELPVPTRTGAKFSGWVDADGGEITSKTEVKRVADHTLYAQWGADLYEIGWDFVGRGNGRVEGAGPYAYGSQPTLKAVPYEGSDFVGWTDGETRNLRRITVVSNATYVAQFDIATYDVTFAYRDAAGNLVTTAPTTVEYGGKVDPPSKDVVDSWPEHTFKTWSTEEYKKVTRDLAVEAVYDTMTYSVAFAYRDWEGNAVTTMPQHVASGGKANPPDRSVVDNWTGNTFKGWAPDYNVIRQDTLCEAIYEINTYTVTFSYCDARGKEMQHVEYVTHGEKVPFDYAESVKNLWTGHRFVHWSYGGRAIEDIDNVIATGNMRISAAYEGYARITYAANGGEGAMPMQVYTNYVGDVQLARNAFTRTGYLFAGWSTDGSDNPVYNDGATVTVSDGTALALTACWTPITYTLAFDGNGGTCKLDPKILTYDTPATIEYEGNKVSRDRCDFLFWSTDPKETNTVYRWSEEDEPVVSNLTTVADKTIVWYAIWKGMPQKVTINGEPVELEYGSQLEKPADPETVPTGYAFSGNWTSNGVAVSFPITVTGSFDLMPVILPIQYQVRFNGAGSDGGTMEPQTFTYDVEQPLTSNAFTRTGYAFAGWAIAEGGDTTYAEGQAVRNLASTDGAVVDLYATWDDRRSYTVRFNPNGGEGSSYSQGIPCGKATALTPNTFTRTGYGFAGWAAAEGSGSTVVYTNGESVTDLVAEGATKDLYAVWTPNTYWVAFEGNGSDGGAMEPQAFTYDVAQALTSNAFTRTGYAFAGWAAAENSGSTADYADGAAVSNLTAEANATNTLWATWTVKRYAITFDSAGGSAVGSVTNDYGAAVAAPANPTRTGYTFAGWYRGEAKYEFGQPMPAEDIVLTARWAPNAYTVHFDPGEGDGTMKDQQFVYDVAQALTGCGFTRTGYVFAGWSAAESIGSTVDYADGATVSNLTPTANGVVTLWAVWGNPPSYTVRFNANGGDGAVYTQDIECGKATALTPNRFTLTGYTFAGWAAAEGSGSTVVYTNGESVTDLVAEGATKDLYAVWTPNTYWVAFEGNGSDGGAMEPQAFTYNVAQALTPNGFTRTGYTFAGWVVSAPRSEDAAGTVDYADKATVSNLTAEANATNTLWATWLANQYTVVYHGPNGETSDQSFTYDKAQNLKGADTFVPPEPWMVFAGWTNAVGNIYAAGTTVSNLTVKAGGTVNLYAVWGDDSYTVIFDGNGATGGTMKPQIFKHGDKQPLNSNEYVRIGHTFANWTNDAGTAYADKAPFTAPTAGIGETLYAVWDKNQYKDSFDGQSETFDYGETVTRAAPSSKTGYTFKGWTTNGIDVINLDPATSTFVQPDHDIVFTSKWEPITYTVTFNANGGTGSVDPITAIYDQPITLASSNDFSWSGHEFVAWTNANYNAQKKNALKSDAIVSNLTTIADETVTLYVQWKESGDPLRMALNLGSEFDGKVSVSAEGAWTVIGDAKEANGILRTSDSPDGKLRVTVPSAGTLVITFDPQKDSTGLGLTVTMDGDPEPWFEDDPSAKEDFELETGKGGTFVFSGIPSAGATWTLKNFKWTAK